MEGFKSFPDRIEIEIGKGITSIVGPNGSGKSNISDAILWALGEQSAKTLRGAKMEDVIFSGTQSRQPLGFAEVSVTFDNSDGTLPVSFDEVEVRRRVYRSGDSEYTINRTPCRLKDIHELFMDTGVGKDGYSIIGQGRIETILSTKSEERRTIFEEAAGISKYRYKRDESQRKLERTQDNLTRIGDIVSELELQVEPLYQQQKKAKRFLELKEELKTLEVNSYLERIDSLLSSGSETDEQYHKLQKELNLLKQEIEEAENKAKALYEEINRHDEEIETIRGQMKENEELKNTYLHEIDLFQNDIGHSKEAINRYKNEQQAFSEKLSGQKEQLAEILAKYQTVIELKKEAENNIIALTQELNCQINDVEAKNSLIDRIKSNILEQTDSVAALKLRQSSMKVTKENNLQRLDDIAHELNALQQEQSSFLTEENTAKQAVHRLEEQLEFIAKKLKDIEQTAQELKIRWDKQAFNKDAAEKELQHLNSRKHILSELEAESEGLNRSTKAVVRFSQKGRLKNIYGPVASLVSVSKKYALAIETALGFSLQNIVTKTEEDAQEAIALLKKERAGRATFLPVSAVKGTLLDDSQIKHETGYLGLAVSLASFDKEFNGVFTSLLGRVVVVDTLQNAVSAAKKHHHKFKIVTLEGDLLSPGGAMSGGSSNKTAGILSRRAQLTDLDREISEKNRKFFELTQLSEGLQAEYMALQEEAAKLKTQQNNLLQEKIRIEEKTIHVKQSGEALVSRLLHLQAEQKTLQQALLNLDQENALVLEEIKAAEEKIQQMTDEVHRKQAAFAETAARRDQMNSDISSQKMLLTSFEKDISHILSQKTFLDQTIAEISQQLEGSKAATVLEEEKIGDMESDISFKQEQITGILDTLKEQEAQIQQILANKGSSSQVIRENQEQSKKMMERLFSKQEAYTKLENRKNKTEMELETIYDRLWEDYELTYSSAQEFKTQLVSERSIGSVKDSIKRLGNINLDAIEEYEKVKERYDFLTGQQKDLQESIISLNKVISDMTKLMQSMFAENFEKINQKFGQVFAELFGGGNASLILADPSDVLTTSIEIEVQPPGKRLQSISLLSGGEKSFTAIAILFAILSVRPTPFCILDEIEAALDEGNVYRFAQYLSKFTAQTQFIVVTHRRGTMEAANILYGVTMQEKGVSKLLPLSLDDLAV